jgi:hypothetical protein
MWEAQHIQNTLKTYTHIRPFPIYTLKQKHTYTLKKYTRIYRRKAAPHTEYVLEFVVERKSVPDLLSSIQDSSKQRFQRQKWWLLRCGLRQPVYLLEGDATAQNLKGVCSAVVCTYRKGMSTHTHTYLTYTGPPGCILLPCMCATSGRMAFSSNHKLCSYSQIVLRCL